MNANIMKTQYMVMEKFCDFSDPITTLPYVLMDNFCPCFKYTSSSFIARLFNLAHRGLSMYYFIRDVRKEEYDNNISIQCIGNVTRRHEIVLGRRLTGLQRKTCLVFSVTTFNRHNFK